MVQTPLLGNICQLKIISHAVVDKLTSLTSITLPVQLCSSKRRSKVIQLHFKVLFLDKNCLIYSKAKSIDI